MLDTKALLGKNIAVLGYGLEGKSTLKFLLKHKIPEKSITVLDKNKEIIIPKNIKSICGDNYEEELSQYDIIFKSAGIPISPNLKLYQKKISNQIQFFFDNYKGKIVAITASKGKSTMVSLIYSLLINAGYNVKLVGNIGNPVLDEIELDQEHDYVVVELSSYMLDTLKKKNFISVLGSIFPEHLDRHGDFKKYTKAKLNILKGSETNIVNNDTIKNFSLNKKYTNIISYGKEGYFGRKGDYFTKNDHNLFSSKNRILEGEHNLDNICPMIAIGNKLGINENIIQETIRNFQGLPHRMQKFGTYHGINFIDDAISTTPESTIQAIKTFGKGIDTILLGGTDRGYDFHELVKVIKKYRIKNIVLFPESGKKILDTFGDYANKLNIFQTDSMEKAVDFCIKNTTIGKTCLLSTASPSYSLWKNFEEKGSLFQIYIKKYKKIGK